MRDSIIKLASCWHDYYQQKHVDGKHAADILINSNLRSALEVINIDSEFDNLLTGSSSGEGNITRAPWFASFDTRITKTATQGFYVVYLFSTDLKTITLELGLGATQFTSFYGKNNTGLTEIRKAALKMQDFAISIAQKHCKPSFYNKLKQSASSITNVKSYSLQRGYEEGAILHIKYEIEDLPDNTSLIADYREFIKIYQLMVTSSSTPKMSELLSNSIETADLTPDASKTLFVDFKPRPPAKNNSKGHSKNKKSSTSSSGTSTKVIGDWGEKFILDSEIQYLTINGRADLAKRIAHEEAENNRPGWDITSFDIDGVIKRIEVKSSETDVINTFNLTSNERFAALEFGESYYLYLLTGVNAKGAKKVEIIKNPAKLIDEETIQIRPVMYEIKLSPKIDI